MVLKEKHSLKARDWLKDSSLGKQKMTEKGWRMEKGSERQKRMATKKPMGTVMGSLKTTGTVMMNRPMGSVRRMH